MLETKYGMKYPFPHTLVHIVDNSAYTGDLPVVIADNPSMYGTIVVSGFPMGEDNRMIGITRSDILNVAYGLSGIGASEIQKFGQTITYPVALIDQGAPIQLMRVTPSDATYAYSCIVIEWAWEESSSKMHVRYNTAKLDNDRDLMNYKNRDRLAAAIISSVKKDDIDDGTLTWKRRAFIVNVSAGRGAAYNNFATSVNQTIQQKKPANARYLFTTTDMRTNTTVEQYIASLINDNNTDRIDATDNVNVIMGKRADGSSVVVQYLNEDAIRELYNDYRDAYASILTNNASIVDEYERNVYRVLNINTFDPIFGLYLYNGTDETQKLPFFQVDMVESDVPRLDESNIVYYWKPEDDEPVDETSKLLKEKLMSLSLGFGTSTKTDRNGKSVDTVLLGDMYLYSGFATTNNPYIYIVAAINQYTGAVTTVRTNQLHFYGKDATGSDVDADSRLRTIIEAPTFFKNDSPPGTSFMEILKNKINAKSVTDGDTVAWYNTTEKTWSLVYLYDAVNNVANEDFAIEAGANKYVIEYTLTNYEFIDWSSTNASNLIGTNEKDPAWTRVGATCIDNTKTFGDTGLVYVNGLNVTATTADKIEVVGNTDVFSNYIAPPTTISNVVSDVVGSSYDVIECNKAKAQYVQFEQEADSLQYKAIQFTNGTSGKTAPVDRKLGWRPYDLSSGNTTVALFNVTASGDDFSMRYDPGKNEPIDISKEYIGKYLIKTGGVSLPLYVARNVLKGYKFATSDSKEIFYSENSDKFVAVDTSIVAPEWDDTKFYFTAETGGDRVETKPETWSTTYGDYYVADTLEGERTQVTGVTKDQYTANTYFKKDGTDYIFQVGGNTPGDWGTADLYYKSTDGGQMLTISATYIYLDLGAVSETPKYYLYSDTTSAFTEAERLLTEDQIIRVYKKTGSGNWILDTATADTGTPFTDAGYMIPDTDVYNAFNYEDTTKTVLQDAMDSRCADHISRYVVVGTVGSLYRSQDSGLIINSDYYSDTYGINFTSTYGGVQLEDGSTGFFDRTDITTIEFKWLYAKLLVDAFRGKIDPRIMSPVRTPAKYLFDGAWNTVVGQLSLPTMNYSAGDIVAASTMYTEDEKDEVLFNPSITDGWDGNTDVDVKQAMYDLMDYRVYQGIPEDKRPLGPGSGLSLHLDSGVTDEATAQVINKSFTKRFDNPNASWDIGGIVSSADGLPYTFTKKIVDNLVAHCKANTVNKPFTGIYTKILKNEYVSYFPDIDTTDWEYRELMYNSGGNAWLPDVNGTLMRRSQRTLMRGSDTSDLIQESNMRTLSQLVYLLQNKLEEKLFEYNDDSVLRTMQDEVNNMFSNWAGNMVESLNISFVRDINPNDGGEIVVCYVDVVFRGINLRIPVIVNVNRRIASTT